MNHILFSTLVFVKEGDVFSVCRVNPADMAEGRFNFSDKVEQHGDIKTFDRARDGRPIRTRWGEGQSHLLRSGVSLRV